MTFTEHTRGAGTEKVTMEMEIKSMSVIQTPIMAKFVINQYPFLRYLVTWSTDC